MSEIEPEAFDAYRPPETQPEGGGPSSDDPALARKFREQMLALGVLWILIGAGAAGLVWLVVQGNMDLAWTLGGESRLLLIVTAALGGTWLVVGIFTCAKQMWAVYLGLLLSYLSLLGNLIRLNLCSIVVVALVILQAHRVIGWSRQLPKARQLDDLGA